MQSTRVALIGLGGIADAHLRKLRWIDGAEVVGVCDLSASLAEAIGERFGVPFASDDAERMIAELRPDVVHILTPPSTHRRLVTLALDASAHVFVEKPMAVSGEEYEAMRDAALSAGRLLVEDFNYRFQRVTRQALELVRGGGIGEPVMVDAAMNVGLAEPNGPYADTDVPHFAHTLPGGALFNFASHPASIVTAILGPHAGVRAWRRRLEPAGLSDDELRALVDMGRASATITVTSHAKPSSFTIAVRGTEGFLEADIFSQRLFAATRGGRIGRLADQARHGGSHIAGALASAGRFATGRFDYVEGLGTLLEDFYAAVRGAGPPPLSTADMDATNRLLFALFEEGNQL
jgi:predicted dehydrogenase